MARTIKKVLFVKGKHKYELSPQELKKYEKLRKRRYRALKSKMKQSDHNFRNYKDGDMHDEYYTNPHYFDDAIADVQKYFGVTIDKPRINQIFKPGGDYQNEVYNPGEVIVDNPPFSLLCQICTWFDERGIKFILFCSNPIFLKASIERGKWQQKFSHIIHWQDIGDWLNTNKNVQISLITNVSPTVRYFARKRGEFQEGCPQPWTKEQEREYNAQKVKKRDERGWML